MLNPHIIVTINQKVLGLLAKFPDREFYERQVARSIGIAYGSANRALNELYSTGAVKRRREGKMCFYSIDTSNAAVVEFRKLVNLMLLEPLVDELKNVSSRIVLYGSCAQGTDNSQSDMDLFIVARNKEGVTDAISEFSLPGGFEDINIQYVIKTTVELLKARESEQIFLDEVERGIVLWERAEDEQGF